MRIFLSWSGDRGKAVAVALREWLPLVLHYAQPWLSERDIAAGSRWAVDIGRELEATEFGIVVLTRDSLNSPWLLFESGALSKAFSAAGVCPYLVDLEAKDITEPLSQFQAKKSDKASTLELVQAINGRSKTPVETTKLAALFDALWRQLDDKLASLPKKAPGAAPARAQPEILEELVQAIRRMEAQVALVSHSFTEVNRTRAFASEDGHRDRRLHVEVLGRFDGLQEINEIQYTPESDLIDELAGIAHLDVDSYGQDWDVLDIRRGRPLDRTETLNDLRRWRHGMLRRVAIRSLPPASELRSNDKG